ncbi:MAG: hypothetical protein ACRBDL_02950 [Alphaproteobacteria bacterium]
MTHSSYEKEDARFIPRHVDLAVDFLRKAQTDNTREQRRTRLPDDGLQVMIILTQEFMDSDDVTREEKIAAESILYLLGDDTKRSHKEALENGDVSAYKYAVAHKNTVQAIGNMAADRVRNGENVPVFVAE